MQYSASQIVNIIIIDDETENRRLLTECISNNNYKITFANSLEEFFSVVNVINFDLILVNLEFSDSTAIEVFDKIVCAAKNIPIIAFTELNNEDLKKYVLNNGAKDYFNQNDLVNNNLNKILPYIIENNKLSGEYNGLKEKLLSIYEGMVDGLIILEKESKAFIKLNTNILNMLGYSEEELFKMKLDDIYASNDVVDMFKDIYTHNKFTVHNVPLLKKDGSTIYVDINSKQMFYQNKLCILIFFRDVTEKKKSVERQLFYTSLIEKINLIQSSKECISVTINSIKEYFDFDAVGIRLEKDEDYPFYLTAGFSEDFVLAESSLCEKDEEGHIKYDEKGLPCLDCMCGNVLRGRTDSSFNFFTEKGSFWTNSTSILLSSTTENERQSKTRNRCHGEGYESVALIPLKYNNKAYGLLHLVDLKTNSFDLEMIEHFEGIANSLAIAIERNLLNEELLFNKQNLEKIVEKRTEELNLSLEQLNTINLRLKQANKHKNQFISSMSHELRTPLNSIIGFTQTLEKQYFGDLNERQVEYIGLVKRSGEHLLSLINDILNIAKIDSGSLEFMPENVNAKKCINEIVSIMSAQFKDKKVDLECSIADEIDMFYSDERKCKQILFNLLSNALKFTNEGGKVNVQAYKEGDFVNISVIDDGIGIKEEDLNKIFQEFYQSEIKRDQALGGAGIGLALTERLVKMHGGEIGVESKVNEGSKFYFTIPAHS